MTFVEMMERIKKHNEIHSKKESQDVLITEALNKAIELLENLRWHYPNEMDFPEEGELVLVLTKSKRRYLAVRFWYENDAEDEIMNSGYIWQTEPDNLYVGDLYDDDILAWCRLPNLDEKGEMK